MEARKTNDTLGTARGPFAILLAAGFMTLLDVSIVNVALPSMESALGAGANQLQWIVAGYALSFGLILVAAGRAGDIFGRKRLFVVGLLLFTLASLGCGMAPNAHLLAASRFIQGLGAGVLNPQVLGVMQELFTGRARVRAFGLYGIMVGVSTALGPVLGGALIAIAGPVHGWRLVFLINMPIGLVVAPLAARMLPRSKPKRSSKSLVSQFDPVGVVMLGVLVLCIMLPFLETSSSGSGGGAPYWLLAVSVAIGVAFTFWERFWMRRGGVALLDPELMASPSFALGVLAAFFYFGGFTSILLVLTLFLQQSLGWSALAAGLASVPFAVFSGTASGISGRMVNRFGRYVPVFGSALVSVAVLGIAACATWMAPEHAAWGAISMTAVAGIGSGLMISPNQALTLDGVPLKMAGLAAALLQTFQRLGTAIGLSAVTTAYFLTLGRHQTQGAPAAGGRALAAATLVIAAIVALSVVANVADLRRRGHRVEGLGSDVKGESRNR